ncbi:MAG TPA: SAM-dependent methyltransferase [Vicinamibacterales bacterium]|jgi:methyltransferase (TIGR00027 family)|nr:SAM-dependent methyltransferase [Vicinamibacterales bacterium]
MEREPLVRDISDTAYWVAHYRAMETDRADAVFRDPYARALAGERGEGIAKAQELTHRNAWSFTARTYMTDRFISDEVRDGADLVVNLAAGLDARPYRMDLPKTLRWVEVDLPGILDYKEQVLGGVAPVCVLERVRLDLADETARRALFARLAAESTRAVVVSEGLIIYLDAGQVASLARDLHAQASFHTWILDLASPGLLKRLSRGRGQAVAAAGAPFRFAPAEGPDFFVPLGWTPAEVGSLLKTAARLNRLPLFLRLIAKLPEPKTVRPDRLWSAVIKLSRSSA